MLALTAIAIRVAAVSQLQQLLVTLDKVFVTQPATQLDARSLFFAYQPLFSTVLPQFFAAHLPLFAVQSIPLPATRPVSQLASQPQSIFVCQLLTEQLSSCLLVFWLRPLLERSYHRSLLKVVYLQLVD